MSVTIKFLGASGTVTGSKYLVSDGKNKVLIDCGLFQGERSWREKNWDNPQFSLSEVNAVLITHSHIDHIGMLPRFYNQGLKCPIYTTAAASGLSRMLLLDSGRLQEEEAEYRIEKKKSRHAKPVPLYTEKDALEVTQFFKNVPFDKKFEVMPGVHATWKRMGHIVGAASIKLEIGGKIINFSGDVGRYGASILKDPEPVSYGDLLLIESTYADRLHGKEDPKLHLAEIVNNTYKRKGVVIIPSFAVGRAQQLLFHFRELKEEKLIPDIPVIIDSPMAKDATNIYAQSIEEYDEETRKIFNSGKSPFHFSKLAFTKDRSESIKLNSVDEPMVIISASGMLGGGRVLHHLKHRIADPRNTVLFVGFQPPGSRGAWIKSGAPSLMLLGDEIPIRAEVDELSMLSAHADRDELIRWCKSGSDKPGKVAVVHGEPPSAKNFSETLKMELNWDAFTPSYLETYTL